MKTCIDQINKSSFTFVFLFIHIEQFTTHIKRYFGKNSFRRSRFGARTIRPFLKLVAQDYGYFLEHVSAWF